MSKTAAGSDDRHDSSAPERWVLLTGSRLLVSLVILLVIGLVFVTTAVLGLATGLIVVTTLLPLVILSAYILRVATIAQQTAAFGPFVPESER